MEDKETHVKTVTLIARVFGTLSKKNRSFGGKRAEGEERVNETDDKKEEFRPTHTLNSNVSCRVRQCHAESPITRGRNSESFRCRNDSINYIPGFFFKSVLSTSQALNSN